MVSLAVVTLTSYRAFLKSDLVAFVHAYYLECFTLFSNKLCPSSSTLCSMCVWGGASDFCTWRPRAKRNLEGSYGNSFPSLISSIFGFFFKRNRNTHHLPFLKLQKINIVYNVELAPISLIWPVLFSSTNKSLLKRISKCVFMQPFFSVAIIILTQSLPMLSEFK